MRIKTIIAVVLLVLTTAATSQARSQRKHLAFSGLTMGQTALATWEKQLLSNGFHMTGTFAEDEGGAHEWTGVWNSDSVSMTFHFYDDDVARAPYHIEVTHTAPDAATALQVFTRWYDWLKAQYGLKALRPVNYEGATYYLTRLYQDADEDDPYATISIRQAKRRVIIDLVDIDDA